MRFIFKTDYAQDLRLAKHGGHVFWYGLLMVLLLAAPWWASEYVMSQLHFICIYSIVGFGLMMLTGFTGQVSLGHAAFLAVGAYTEALMQAAGVPFVVSIASAALFAAALGVIVGLPALRLKGIYLAIATLAFSLIVEHLMAHWKWLSAGETFMTVPKPVLAGLDFGGGRPFYFAALAVLVLVVLAVLNLLRAPIGRAFIALRDSPIAAETLGVALARTKATAFALSAAITGLAGALYAHKITVLNAESFNVLISLQLLMMVVVGGLGTVRGAVYGAVFVGLLDPVLARVKDALPKGIGGEIGLQLALYGFVIVAFVLFEPQGLAGRWAKIKAYFQAFPLYRRATYKRGKSYMTSERLK